MIQNKGTVEGKERFEIEMVKVIGYHNPKTGLKIQLKKCFYKPIDNYTITSEGLTILPTRAAYKLLYGKEGYLNLPSVTYSLTYTNLADALRQVDALIDKDQEYLYGLS